MQHNDTIRVKHMLAAAKEALAFSEGQSRKDLENNRILVLAIIKSIEIIGEAATKVSKTFQLKYRTVPWSEIVNMRHRMIHAYYDVNLDIVWATVINDLPPLVESLQNIITAESGSE